MTDSKCNLGWPDDMDGTLLENLERNMEINFRYEGIVYLIEWNDEAPGGSKRTVIDQTNNEYALTAVDDDMQKFLDMPFLGKTLKEIIDNSFVMWVY